MSKTIELTQANNKYAVVDDEDYPELIKWKWGCTRNGYARRQIWNGGKGKAILMHRQIINAPEGFDVDHINGDRLDNRRSNLRICTRSQNMANMHNRTRNRYSKYKGVSWNKARSKWEADLRFKRKTIHLGRFENEIDAAKAYDAAARRYFGEFAYINFREDNHGEHT